MPTFSAIPITEHDRYTKLNNICAKLRWKIALFERSKIYSISIVEYTKAYSTTQNHYLSLSTGRQAHRGTFHQVSDGLSRCLDEARLPARMSELKTLSRSLLFSVALLTWAVAPSNAQTIGNFDFAGNGDSLTNLSSVFYSTTAWNGTSSTGTAYSFLGQTFSVNSEIPVNQVKFYYQSTENEYSVTSYDSLNIGVHFLDEQGQLGSIVEGSNIEVSLPLKNTIDTAVATYDDAFSLEPGLYALLFTPSKSSDGEYIVGQTNLYNLPEFVEDTFPDGKALVKGLSPFFGLSTNLAQFDLIFELGTPIVLPKQDNQGNTLAVISNGSWRYFSGDSRTRISNQIAAGRVARVNTAPSAGAGDASNVVISSKSRNGMIENLYTWFEYSGFYANDDQTDREFRGNGIQVGADFELNEQVTVGLSFAGQNVNATRGTTSVEGELYLLQPYIGFQSGAWSGVGTLSYGEGSYDQYDTSGTGAGETVQKGVSITGSYAFDYAGATITPTMGIAFNQETLSGVSGTLAGVAEQVIDSREISVGARYTRDFNMGSYFVGLHADHLTTNGDTALNTDLLIDDGWTGRIELGGRFDVGNDNYVDTSIEFSGLGGDLQQMSGGIRATFHF